MNLLQSLKPNATGAALIPPNNLSVPVLAELASGESAQTTMRASRVSETRESTIKHAEPQPQGTGRLRRPEMGGDSCGGQNLSKNPIGIADSLTVIQDHKYSKPCFTVADGVVTIQTSQGLADVKIFDSETVCSMCDHGKVEHHGEEYLCAECRGTGTELPRVGRAYTVKDFRDVPLSEQEQEAALQQYFSDKRAGS